MLNEPASSLNDDHPKTRPMMPLDDHEPDARYAEIREAVENIMAVEDEEFFLESDQPAPNLLITGESQLLVKFTGKLNIDPEMAYNTLDAAFESHDLLPVFRQEDKRHAVYVVQGRVKPIEGGGTLSIILFVLTVLSVLFVGAQMAISEIMAEDFVRGSELASNFWANIWRGWPYATSILLILGGHELGHYFMARHHKTAASLPYFLPFPFGVFGTFGAAIRLREPMKNRKVLLDIGAAGPLTGLVLAIPILLIGLATSQVGSPLDILQPGSNTYFSEGNSVLYSLSKFIVFGRFLPDGGEDVFVNQLAWAGWTGLLVTGLNLIPLGQLDGGHVLYALFGRRAKQVFFPAIVALLLLTVLVANELFVFVLLIMLMGNQHAVPLDDITPLDNRRRGLALFTLGVFFLVFVPQPLTQTVITIDGRTPGQSVLLPLFMLLAWSRREWFMRRLRQMRQAG